MRLRLAGVKPNSDAIRIMISAWRFAIERYGDWIGKPCDDLKSRPVEDARLAAVAEWLCACAK